jgi:Ca2+-binding EF-hand superfamily protein
MRKLFPLLSLLVATAALPQFLQADEPPKPQRPSPESMFKRLDANKDGVITADELPAGMPERMKQMVTKADKDGDKKVTLEELLQAFKDHKPADRPEKRPEGRPERRPEGRAEKGPGGPDRPTGPDPEVMFKRLDANKDGIITADELPAGMPERMKQMLIKADKDGDKKVTLEELKSAIKARREGNRPEGRPDRPEPRPEGRPEKGLSQHSMQSFRANLPEMPNLKVIFDRLDSDKDSKLSFDEFKVGMAKMHQFFAARLANKPAPANRYAGKYDEFPPKPWMTMRQTGWEPAGRPGPQGYGPGPQGHGPQFRGYAQGWQPKHGPQFHSYAHNGWQGRGHKFHGYAHGWHQGKGCQSHGYAHGWQQDRGPQFHGYRPQGHGPHFHGYPMNQFSERGPQHRGPGMGHGPKYEGRGPEVRGPHGRGPQSQDGEGH